MDARYRWAELPTRAADQYQVLHRKMSQVRNSASAALLLPVLALCLTSCVRIGAPNDNGDATAQVEAAQLKIEDQAWSLRSIFFRPDFGPEWREIRDAQGKPTVGLPFADCLAAAQGNALDPKTITANAGSPRFTARTARSPRRTHSSRPAPSKRQRCTRSRRRRPSRIASRRTPSTTERTGQRRRGTPSR